MRKIYLYHVVRRDVKGNKTLPFGSLYKSSEELYKGALSKFPNQYKLENQNVEILNCLKKDVIFMTAIPPKVLNKEHIRRTGISLKGTEFYKIKINSLEMEKLCLCLTYEPEELAEFFKVTDEVLSNFDMFKDYTREAKEYWETIRLNDKKTDSLLFSGTYLFLYKGSIDINNLKIIKL